MSASALDDTSLSIVGDQKDMGSITSLTKTDKNQDFSTEGVTRGVEDDIPDDDCILSEKGIQIDTFNLLDKVCGDSVNDDNSFMMNNKVVDIKEKSLSKCVIALQEQQSADHVNNIATESMNATASPGDKDIDSKNIAAETTSDKYGKSFPNRQDKLPGTRFDNTATECQIIEGSSQYPDKASSEKKSQIRPDVLKAQSKINSCSTLPDERVDCSHNTSGKNNENHIYKKSIIIETLMNILSRNQKQLENKTPSPGAVTTNVKSQTVDNKRADKGYLHSFTSFLSVPPTKTLSINTEATKLPRSSVTPDEFVFDASQVRKQLKSGVERVISQLEKLQKTLDILPFKTDNSFASTISDSLKNQIKGMTTAIIQMYHIVSTTPQKNLSFLDTLNQMATQLNKVKEEMLKIHDTTQDPVTYLLHFQGTLDSLRQGDIKAEDMVTH